MFSPRGEILAAFRYRRVEITENISVDGGDCIFFLRTRDKVDAAEGLKLGKLEHGGRQPQTATYNVCVLVLVKYI